MNDRPSRSLPINPPRPTSFARHESYRPLSRSSSFSLIREYSLPEHSRPPSRRNIRRRFSRYRGSPDTDDESDENEPPGNGLNDELFWDANDRKTRQTRHREYSRPRSLDRDWLSFDISLGPATLSQPSGRHGQAEHVVLLRKSPGKVTEFQISAAIYRTGDDDAKVDLHLMEASNEWNGMRWYHVQQNELQLEPLIDMVDSKPGLDASDRLLAAGLLREVHAECSWKQRTSRLPPGFIRRHCGKTAHRAKDRPDNAVVFMSVPFFSNEIRPTAFSSSQSPTTTLLQAGYPDDNTPASSSAAARSASKTPPGVPELCVSHLWLLLCNKGISQTYTSCNERCFRSD